MVELVAFDDPQFLPLKQSLGLDKMSPFVQQYLDNHDIIWRRIETVPIYSPDKFLSTVAPSSISHNDNYKFETWKVMKTLAT